MRRIRFAVAAAPVVGGVAVAAAALHAPLYRFLVREDALLEWAQVAAYAVAAAAGAGIAARLLRDRRRAAGAAFVAFALASLFVLGEEISWGQRLLGFETSARLSETNRQNEMTLHNTVAAEEPFRFALLAVAGYGTLAAIAAPRIGRRSRRTLRLFAPPPLLALYFAVPLAYFAFRLLMLPQPTYEVAKFSEWPELCLASGIAASAGARLRDAARARAPEVVDVPLRAAASPR